MNLAQIQPAKGSVHSERRIGRGQGSGMGGTSTRGHKGAKSRSGYSRKKGFEGGQMPIQRRLPKFGFTNISRKNFKGVNLSTLQALADMGVTTINPDVLREAGLAPKNSLIKILGNGELKAKLDVKAHGFSKSAQAAIEALQGTVAKL